MSQFSLYTTAVKIIGVYFFIASFYDLLSSMFWLSPGNWSDEYAVTTIAYSVVLTFPILFSAIVIRKADFLVRSLKLVKDESDEVSLGKWDLQAMSEMALLLLSGYFILINVVPFVTAVIDFFADSVRVKYPYNITPDQKGYYDMYDFISGTMSLLVGVIIITNVRWFAQKLVGRYSKPTMD